MSLELIPARADHVPEISRIIFQAFKGISERHGFPLDIPSVEVATMIANMFTQRPDFHGVTAVLDGKIVGSNFLQLSDPVGGVGPITVDPACQTRGVGRRLMQYIVDWGLKNHGPSIRLMQDGFNMTSLSLYTSLGFAVVEPVVLMSVKPAESGDETVRPLKLDDLPACDALCRRIIKVSRKNELADMIAHGGQMGVTPHGRFKNSRLTACLVPGFLGFGVAESAEDFLATVTQAARNLPPPAHKVFVPARNGDLFRGALGRGMKSIKLMSLMALGPYEEPMAASSGAAWSPSIAY